MKKFFITLFFLLCAAHLTGIALSFQFLADLTKPALVAILAVWYWLCTTGDGGKIRSLFLSGLLFSVAGDVFLMLRGSTYFLFGLSSFLIAHIFYILTFYGFSKFKHGLVFRKPVSTLPVIAFLGLFLAMVYPNVPAQLGAPVFIYSLVIALMVMSAINLFGRITATAAKTILGGAVLFLISDSILACEKFHVFSNANGTLLRIFVMATYLSGQYFLAKGMVKALSNSQ